MNPSIVLKSPSSPLNTHPATTVNELYELLVDPAGYSFEYRVGERTTKSIRLRIRNNTLNLALEITISFPPFIVSDFSTFVLTANEIKDVILSLNEIEFLNGTFKQGSFQDDLVVTVTPESLIEVPLIPNDLSPLIL